MVERSTDAEPAHAYGEYHGTEPMHTSEYIWEPVFSLMAQQVRDGAVLDAGCGNGAFCLELHRRRPDLQIVGIDLEASGIAHAAENNSGVQFINQSVYDDLVRDLDRRFDAVVSLEVIEHLAYPRTFLQRIHEVLKPDGVLILSTPYHGYLKNLALAVTGKMDDHFTVLWEGGHIKFWSRRTMQAALEECGFRMEKFVGTGRLPYLWKSMVVMARPKPQ